jgi:hypothetical protein
MPRHGPTARQIFGLMSRTGPNYPKTLVALWVLPEPRPTQLRLPSLGYWLFAQRYISDAPASASALRSPFVRQT